MVGQVLDEAQQQRRAQTGDPGQESDEDDAAAELKGAPIHAVNLCVMAQDSNGMLGHHVE